MRWAPHLLLCLCVSLGAADPGAPAPVSKDDLAELEQLKQKMRTDADEPTTAATAKPAAPTTKGGMSPEDQAELDALRSQIKARQPEVLSAPPVLVQLIRPEVDGLELVLVLDLAIPTPVVIQGSGHTTGQKFTVQGTYSGAAKFEGAYYPLLKSAEPVVNTLATKEAPKDNLEHRPVLGATETESEAGIGFQLSNILFAGFAAISLTIFALKVKAKVDAMKGKKKPRRR